MVYYPIIIGILFAYFMGSIPTAVWVGKKYYGIDVRDHGSGNAGATNTFRVLGQKAGFTVLIIDMLKGFSAVYFSVLIVSQFMAPEVFEANLSLIKVLSGSTAVFGHVFPVFAGFRGGKGVATICGAVVGIHPLGSIIGLSLFFIVLLIWKYVSLGSIIGVSSFPITVFIIEPSHDVVMKVFSITVAIIFIFIHKSNIIRLLNHTENKTYVIGENPDKKHKIQKP